MKFYLNYHYQSFHDYVLLILVLPHYAPKKLCGCVYIEYPDETNFKPEDISWNDYYRFLVEKRIPLYYNGDRIVYIPFSPELINTSLQMILPYINLKGIVNIAFINKEMNPVVIVKYPEMRSIVKSDDYDSIEKVLFFIDREFEPHPTVNRGRKSITAIREERQNKVNRNIIYRELTSREGTPPIYGIIEEEKFRIITFPPDQRVVNNQQCEYMTIQKLAQISSILGIKWDIGLPLNICSLIQEHLEEIGHML